MILVADRNLMTNPPAWQIVVYAVLLLCVSGLFSCPACASIYLDGDIFGTTYHLEARSETQALDARALQRAVEDRLHTIDAQMSTWKAESDVSLFNRADADQWVPVSDETVAVIRLAQSIHKRSNGAFDITVGPVLKLWNFGPAAGGAFQVPDERRIATALARVGSQHLLTERNPPRLKKRIAQVEVDLSAIAKGYAVDAVCETLGLAGADHYLVEIGGEVRTRGVNASGSPWRIGIESPTPHQRGVASVVALRDEAMATSGDYRNFFERDGRRYAHTIDPTTGQPVSSNVTSVTVFAQTCAEADAYATALMAMGDDAIEWANRNGIEALFFVRQGNDISSRTSAAFATSRLRPGDASPSSQTGGFVTALGATAVVFGLAIFGMSLGLLLANRRLRGSCGGLSALPGEGDSACALCTRPSEDCVGNVDPQAREATD